MVQKYQNEIPPIFYYGISTKTNEKDLKLPDLQALTLGRIIKMTLYLALLGSKSLWIHENSSPLTLSAWVNNQSSSCSHKIF